MELKPDNLLLEIVYLQVFKSVKSVLDSKISVSRELF